MPSRFAGSFLIFLFIGLGIYNPVAGQTVPQPHFEFQDLSPREQAEALLFRKQYEEAISSFKRILRKGTDHSYVFRGLVKAYEGSGRLQEAQGEMEPFLSRNPEHSAPLYGMGYAFYLQNRHKEAEEYFKKALKIDPENSLALNNWGAILAFRKNYRAALDKVKRAIGANPNEPMFYQNLYSIYSEMGEQGTFIAEYRENIESGAKLQAGGYGRVLAKARRQEGFRLYQAGDIKGTIEKFAEMVTIYRQIKHTPGIVQGLFSLGLLMEEDGNIPAAKNYFLEVLQINPRHLQAGEKLKSLD